MRRFSKAAASIALACLLSACVSRAPGPAGPKVDPAEKNALNALSHDDLARAGRDLDIALARYRRLDDQSGEWRIHCIKAELALSRGDDVTAKQEADSLRRLSKSIGGDDVAYRTGLILGRVSGNADYFKAALDAATTPLQQAVAQTYLGNTARAVALVDPKRDTRPGDVAFVYYRRAVAVRSPELFEKALHYYRRAGDPRGVADSLVNLARLAAQSDRTDAAKAYARRAIHALDASGDARRADTVRSWMGSL